MKQDSSRFFHSLRTTRRILWKVTRLIEVLSNICNKIRPLHPSSKCHPMKQRGSWPPPSWTPSRWPLFLLGSRESWIEKGASLSHAGGGVSQIQRGGWGIEGEVHWWVLFDLCLVFLSWLFICRFTMLDCLGPWWMCWFYEKSEIIFLRHYHLATPSNTTTRNTTLSPGATKSL